MYFENELYIENPLKQTKKHHIFYLEYNLIDYITLF